MEQKHTFIEIYAMDQQTEQVIFMRKMDEDDRVILPPLSQGWVYELVKAREII